MKNDLSKIYAKGSKYNNDLKIIRDFLLDTAFFIEGGRIINSNKLPLQIKDLICDIDMFILSFVNTCETVYYDGGSPNTNPKYIKDGLCMQYDDSTKACLIMLDPFSYGM